MGRKLLSLLSVTWVFLIGAWRDAVRFARFCKPYLLQFGHWLHVVYRWLRRVYHRLTRLVRRVHIVEKRIRRGVPRIVFLYRWLHYVLYRIHLLPSWVKLLKLLIVLFFVASPYAMHYWDRLQHKHAIYNKYYPHFYEEYAKTMKPDEAQYYADFYANYFSDYYTSDAYKQALKYALPETTQEAMAYPEDSKVAELTVNDVGLQLIKEQEGLIRDPYLDAAGKLTIGYGHLIRPGEFYDRISEADAEELLRKDIKVAEAEIKRNVQVKLTPAQFSALVSLVYNIGSGHFEESTLLAQLNHGDYEGAGDEFLRWDHVGRQRLKGLTKRRAAERELFMRG